VIGSGLAKDFRELRQRGEEQGLSPDEIAFYDALAENESAVQFLWAGLQSGDNGDTRVRRTR